MSWPSQRAPTDVLQARYGRLAPLTEREFAFLRSVEIRARSTYDPECRILVQGTDIRAPQLIVSGWAASIRLLADGRRQIISVSVPGDPIGLCARARPRALATVIALTTVRTVEALDLAVGWRDVERLANLSEAIDLADAEDEYFLICNSVRLGRQTAYERLANFFCELEYRLSGRRLANNGEFAMPMTQEMLADAMGLSVVHVNRTLQQMRREGRIELTRSRLALLDRDGLRLAGEFRPPEVSGGRP